LRSHLHFFNSPFTYFGNKPHTELDYISTLKPIAAPTASPYILLIISGNQIFTANIVHSICRLKADKMTTAWTLSWAITQPNELREIFIGLRHGLATVTLWAFPLLWKITHFVNLPIPKRHFSL
jgi:hypothetical protein